MAARPCPVSLCDCLGVDAPVTNISAEAPDPLLFWGQVWNPYNPYKPIPLGDGQYVKTDCDAVNSLIASYDPIVYAGTQILANLQALAIQLGCPWPTSGDEIFTNDAQTATVYCPDGTAFTYTVDAGTLTSPAMDPELGSVWVLWANAWAAAYAFEQASALLDCVVPDDDTDGPGPDKPNIPLGAGILPGPVWMCFGEDLFHRYRVSGKGAAAYTLEISGGALPPGCTFTQDGPRTGYISGTPTAPGEYTYTIHGTSTTAPTTTVEVTDNVWVMGITNADSLPDAQTGIAYSEQLVGAGGTAPFTFATADTLPDGLSLASDGTISGTPTVDGSFTLDVTITDANGGECIQTIDLTVVTGFHNCDASDWGFFNSGGPCVASVNPVWDGVFNLATTWFPPNNYPLYYFINRSVSSLAVAASDAPNYPAGDWQNLDVFTQLAWDGTNWFIVVACGAGSILWYGIGPANLADPTGAYAYSIGTTGIATLNVIASGPNYALSTVPVPLTWAAPQPTQVRIKNYASVLTAFGSWCGTICGPVCGTLAPVWNGTMPDVLNPDPSNLAYLSEFPIAAGFNVAGANTEARIVFVPSTGWNLEIGILLGTVDGWYGEKLCGATPIGTYNRLTPFGNPGDPGGCSPGPSTITIESY